jgi:membrane fusion protein, multidrug efflux system
MISFPVMKKFIVLPIFGAFILILVLVKIFTGSEKERLIQSQPAQRPVDAECTVARHTPGEFTYTAVGKTRANERVELVSEIAGRLVSVHFREGTKVTKGDLLFHLDDTEWTAEMVKLQAKLDLARDTEERNRVLLDSGGISRQVFDEIASQRKILEAEEQILQVKIGKANIRAPFDGITGIRSVSEGAYLVPGTILTVLEDLGSLKIVFTVPEVYAVNVRKGNRISFRVDGIPGTGEAVIMALDPSANEATGNFRVMAIVENPDPALRAGVAVIISIQTAGPAPALYLPTQALVPLPGGYHVYTLDHGKATVRKVITGIRSEKTVEIVAGINPGDTVLLTGFMRIRPGNPVNIVKVW